MKTTLTRSNLTKNLSKKLSLSSSQASDFLEAALEEIIISLSNQENVKIMGFGSFIIRQKKRREGRNPRTMKTAPIAPRSVVLFKPSTQLRKKVR